MYPFPTFSVKDKCYQILSFLNVFQVIVAVALVNFIVLSHDGASGGSESKSVKLVHFLWVILAQTPLTVY